MQKIYFDMDGVLVDFPGWIRFHYGKEFEELDNKWIWDELEKDHPRMYRQMKPISSGMKLWEKFKHLKPEILTAIPSRRIFPYSAEDKFHWKNQYLGSHVKINFGPYSKDKQFHCSPGDILIDDNPLNIEQWKKNKGFALFFNEHSCYKEAIFQIKEHLKISN